MNEPSLSFEVDALQRRYINALDRKDMSAWLDTFCERDEASYIVTTAESVEADQSLALVMDDNRDRLKDRVTFVTRFWQGIYADYQTRHFVQLLELRTGGDGVVEAESNYLVVYTPSETGETELFSSGVYLDRIEIEERGARFLAKKVIADSAFVERFMAYPI